MREIGSEFWKEPSSWVRSDETLYLSGRTALDAVIRDAMETYGVRCALLPSYCCESMLTPFARNGLDVRFFAVFPGEDGHLRAELPRPREGELLLYMKYFGSGSLPGLDDADLDGWAATAEDMTHTMLCEGYVSRADYSFESVRKWFAVDGVAVGRKRSGRLPNPALGPNETFCDRRNRAYGLKNAFMEGRSGEKEEFLHLFSAASAALAEDYADRAPRPEAAADLCAFRAREDAVRTARRENAKVLRSALADLPGLAFAVDPAEGDTPLFVPVLVKDGRRDALRRALTGAQIYCPVHWPLAPDLEGISDRERSVYREELSLVCDQRYDREDMVRTAEVISAFFKK